MKKYIFLFFLITTNILTCFSQTRYYVSITGSPAGNALSWATACNDLQLVINNASTDDTIWVAQGIYYPIRPADTLNKIDSGNRENSFVLQKDLALYGGFMGNETDLSQRDWENNITVLDGDIGILNDSTDNVYHVVRISADVLIDGFTIRNGHNTLYQACGGGIYKESGSLLLSNSTVSHNMAGIGAGIYSKGGSSITLDNNSISHNHYFDYYIAHSGIDLEDTNIVITNNTVSYNIGYYAIGIALGDSVFTHGNIIIENNFIHDNTSMGLATMNYGNCRITDNYIYDNRGGGITVWNSSTMQINNNHIYSNDNKYYYGYSSRHRAGGITIINQKGTVLLTNNEIYDNHSDSIHNFYDEIGGGGIGIIKNCGKFLIANNLIYNNSTNGYGGGICDWGFSDNGTIVIINNIIYNNKARCGGAFSIGGRGYWLDYPLDYSSLGNAILTNNLIYNNHADNYGGGFYFGNNNYYIKMLVNVTITNNTLANNYASWEGGGIYTYYTTNNTYPVTNIRNSILWGNTSGNNVMDDIKNATMYIYPAFYHCLVSSLPLDNGVISNEYPLFIDTANQDYRLQQCSPAINVGNNAYFSPDSFPDLSSITMDLDSNPRFFNNGIVDLGAYEYQANLSASVGNDTIICYGESASVVFSLTGASSWDVVYTKDGGITYDTLKNITTSPHIITDTYTQTTTYELYSVNNQICDKVFISAQKTITVIPVPILDNILSNDTLCNGEQTTPVVFTGADQYQWSASGGISGLPSGIQTGDFESYKVENNSSSVRMSTITVIPQGTSGGVVCNGKSYTFNVIVYPPTAIPSITGNGFVFCEKDVLEMEASAENFVSYQWYKDEIPLNRQTNRRYVVSELMTLQSGTYHVKVSGYCGEQLSDSITIVVRADSILVEKWDDVILVDNSSEQYLEYQWYKNGIMIFGATNQFYQELGGLNGCYKVNLTLKSGKKEMTCERCLDNVKKLLSIYPNPAKQGISVKVLFYEENKPYQGLMEAMLYSAEGKLLQTKQSYCGNMEINTFGLSTGIYILKITTEDGLIHNEKIMVE
jgi:parallel beta-helix repeat protein